MNRIREKFLNHELSVGTFTQLTSTVAVEALGRTGLDYVLIDTEHSAVGIEFLSSAITAADAAGLVPLVRLNDIARPVRDCGLPGSHRGNHRHGRRGRHLCGAL